MLILFSENTLITLWEIGNCKEIKMMEEEVKENRATGYVRIYRTIKKHWIWNDPNKLKWWIYLLLEVNHNDQKVNIGNQLVECKRGESFKSLRTYAKEWGVSKDAVRSFFNLLKSDEMIVTKSIGISTHLTVCNYDSYQSMVHDKQTAGRQDTYTNKNDKNDNNTSTVESDLEIFNDFRKLYGGTKRGNQTEFDNFKKKTKNWKEVLPYLPKVIKKQIYQREQDLAGGRFVPEWKNLQTWINQKCWEQTRPEPQNSNGVFQSGDGQG